MPVSSRELQEIYASEDHERLKRMDACLVRVLRELRELAETVDRIDRQQHGPFERRARRERGCPGGED